MTTAIKNKLIAYIEIADATSLKQLEHYIDLQKKGVWQELSVEQINTLDESIRQADANLVTENNTVFSKLKKNGMCSSLDTFSNRNF